ncbi:MAG: kinase [Deltaproteobacteria bacterium]|jgi:hypothetical protein|nr:kinase [Deltaproteobacteria bacterium]
MSRVVSITATDGEKVEYVDDGLAMSGGQKEVFWSPDRSYVVAFPNYLVEKDARECLHRLVDDYRIAIFEGEGGESFRELFCWPERIVEWKGMIGLVYPAFDRKFYFSGGPLKGAEKTAGWFASAKSFSRNVPAESRGTLRDHVWTCMELCRAVGRLHSAGLVLADLSDNHLLIDPPTGSVLVTGTDQIFSPGEFSSDVLGSRGYMAPETVKNMYIHARQSEKCQPSVETNLHSLAVLVYGLLLHRHPLLGLADWTLDDALRESRKLGKGALFIEHPKDPANRLLPYTGWEDFLPWADTDQVPFAVLGPHLGKLFIDAFVRGLHVSRLRPTALAWEDALARTLDLMVPCPGPDCPAGWVVVTGKARTPVCPLCGTPWGLPSLPYLDLRFFRDGGKSFPDGGRLVGYEGRPVRSWHADRDIPPERCGPPDWGTRTGGTVGSGPGSGTVAEFAFRDGKWFLVNRGLDSLEDLATGTRVPVDTGIALSHGQELILSRAEGGRTAVAGMVYKLEE